MIDSGWGGGNNRGAIERVRLVESVPFGIREVRGDKGGFRDRLHASGGSEERLEPSELLTRFQVTDGFPRGDITRLIAIGRRWRFGKRWFSADGRGVRLSVDPLRVGFVHEVTIRGVRSAGTTLTEGLPYPAIAYFTLRSLAAE